MLAQVHPVYDPVSISSEPNAVMIAVSAHLQVACGEGILHKILNEVTRFFRQSRGREAGELALSRGGQAKTPHYLERRARACRRRRNSSSETNSPCFSR